MLTKLEVGRLVKKMVIRRIKGNEFNQVLEVFGKAFEKETEITGVGVQRFNRIAKLYRLAEIFLPVFDMFHKDFETILVGVSGNRVIGEIHVVPHGRSVWSLDSTAVDANFRRHGVFAKLMNESLRYILKRHGERILTSLWTTNIPSAKITKRLGFEVFETQILLALEEGRIPPVEFDGDVSIRPLKPTDLREIHQIFMALSPEKTQLYKLAPGDFRDSFLTCVMNRLTWSHSKKLVMEVDGRIAGYAHVVFNQQEASGKIESFYVFPSSRSSKLMSLLLSEVLKFMTTRNIRRIIASINEEWTETLETFERFGFKRIASIYEMVKELV